MNFILHRRLAERDLASAAAGIGAMLPDLWRMADRRMRAKTAVRVVGAADDLRDVLAGVEHHLATDRWFHGHAAFHDGERETTRRLLVVAADVPKLALLGHAAWEMCLDGALLRREGLQPTLDALRAQMRALTLAPIYSAARYHRRPHLASPEAQSVFDASLGHLFERLLEGGWITGYTTGMGIARRIDGMRARYGLARLSPAVLADVADVFDAMAVHADRALGDVIERRR